MASSTKLRLPSRLLTTALAGPSRLARPLPLPPAATPSASSSRSSLPRLTHPARPSLRAASTHTPSLSPSFPPSIPAQVTTLPNGLRVASEAIPTHVFALGLYVDAGARYETPRNSGITHLLDRLSYKSTSRFSDEELMRLVDSLGSSVASFGSRDAFAYATPVYPDLLPQAVSVLASNILTPLFLPQDVADVKASLQYEIREMWSKPEMILQELLHSAAYKDNTLGMPMLCPADQLDVLGEPELRAYMNDWFRPERMVLAGWGTPHDELVELALQHLGSLPASTSTSSGLNTPLLHAQNKNLAQMQMQQSQAQAGKERTYATISHVQPGPDGQVSDFEALAHERARYTGGETFLEKSDEEWVHLQVAFEGVHATDPDVYAMGVIQYLLLGGTSFSAGGPGKGMYSRLHQQVLNRHFQVERAESFFTAYNDSSLIGIWMTSPPSYGPQLAGIVGSQLHAMTGPMMGGISMEELGRAKNQFRSRIVMLGEQRMIAVEDLGRQVLSEGRKESIEEMVGNIDAVTREDVWRVANRIFKPSAHTKPLNFGLGSGAPTIVGMGKNVESLGDVKQTLRNWGLGRQ